MTKPSPANRIRAGLDHPVIDADGHIIEFLPAVRAFNRYSAELFAEHRDRLEPVAVIPMYESAEAIEELEHCTRISRAEDIREVLHEAWELVEGGLLTRGDFRDFMFGHAARMWAGANPGFFDGASVESAVAALLD